MSTLSLTVGGLCIFALGYRFYAKFLATKVAVLDDSRPTPAVRLNDGKDYFPTNKWVLFGHHFAAISGAGPLLGPVLATQFGFLPGALWILIGAVLGGAVHDFISLFASVRRDGRSLSEIGREVVGPVTGLATALAIFFIIMTALAGLAIAVVKALTDSTWGTFSIAMTIPIALFVGLYLHRIRHNKVAEASAIGVVLVFAAVIIGGRIQHAG